MTTDLESKDGRFRASVTEIVSPFGRRLFYLEIFEGDELVFDSNCHSLEECLDWLNRIGGR